ncbi:hypothetical protein chiPu_0014294 [Chiloscyllium punctatum]|uniref:FAM86 N-terminal domain-containing protein n=1 Tax=Chiloscyllium punctatum TaxID=137246 RepID=A0A401SZJ4_CHIPU|nr:hypothetical protein [Chiloscyllium punctatum]
MLPAPELANDTSLSDLRSSMLENVKKATTTWSGSVEARTDRAVSRTGRRLFGDRRETLLTGQRMNSIEENYPLLELEEKDYEFSGHPLKITMFKGASLGVSAYVWGPGIVLCRYFESEKIDFTGKKVLELGSGTGIVGILTVLLGGDVTMTDRPYVLKQIEYNILANIPVSSRHRSRIRALAWGSDQNSFPTDFDIILGSDIVYSPSQFPNLIQTLLYFCKDKTVIFLCSDVKYREGSAEFHEELLPVQFHSQLIHTSGSCCIYKVTRKVSDDED